MAKGLDGIISFLWYLIVICALVVVIDLTFTKVMSSALTVTDAFEWFGSLVSSVWNWLVGLFA